MNPSPHRDVPSILVTGGTGTLGRQVVARLRAAGHDVTVLSRRLPEREPGKLGIRHVAADLDSGDGVEPAIAGAEIIVHAAGSQQGDADKARHLVHAAKANRAKHVLFISVVGADRIPISSAIDRAMFGYFEQKHEAERTIAESGLPWTSLRATQFHDLTFRTVEAMSKMPIVPVPAGWHFQPIDSGEVADRLVELAYAPPAGIVPAIGGPKVYDMADLVRSYLDVVGKRRPIIRVPLPGDAARAFRAGANLVPDRAVGERTWEAFLAERLGRASSSRRSPISGSSRA